jgi:hypothetical protein
MQKGGCLWQEAQAPPVRIWQRKIFVVQVPKWFGAGQKSIKCVKKPPRDIATEKVSRYNY